jgi:hypothetical protein
MSGQKLVARCRAATHFQRGIMKEEYNPIVYQDSVATAVMVNGDTLRTPYEELEGSHVFVPDPFYANDPSVIATFSFDHERLDRALKLHWIILSIYTILLLVSLSLNFILFCFLSLPYYICLIADVGRMRSKQYVRRCTHIAIATTGILADEVSAPNSHILMRRRVLKYDDYKHCYVEKSEVTDSCYRSMEYQVMLKNQNDAPIIFARGLMGTQLFADKVNAMIEEVATQTKRAPIITDGAPCPFCSHIAT